MISKEFRLLKSQSYSGSLGMRSWFNPAMRACRFRLRGHRINLALAGALFCFVQAAGGHTPKPAGTGGQVQAAHASAPQTSPQPVNAPADPSQRGSLAPSGPAGTSVATPATPSAESSEYPEPHISIATEAPAAAPISWQERIAWVAKILLAILAYVGIMLALSLLRKIERQSKYMETAAVAASEAAQAALLQARALAAAERPWIAIEAQQVAGAEDAFMVMAVNRGRSPARLTAAVDASRIVRDESELPASPEFDEDADSPFSPILLLPGESTRIRSFSRNEVTTLCDSEEKMRRVESWEARIYLYGKVQYADLTSPAGHESHESGWCCWYIHGQRRSGMVAAGPESYHRHS